MTAEQRRFLADKLATTAHILFATYVIGQSVTDKPIRIGLFMFGVASYFVLLLIGVFMIKGGKNDGSS